jgi:hypothetical protein
MDLMMTDRAAAGCSPSPRKFTEQTIWRAVVFHSALVRSLFSLRTQLNRQETQGEPVFFRAASESGSPLTRFPMIQKITSWRFFGALSRSSGLGTPTGSWFRAIAIRLP